MDLTRFDGLSFDLMTIRAEVIVYHDETKQAGPNGNLRGHVLYFVPRLVEKKSSTPLFGPESKKYNPQELLLTRMEEIIDGHGVSDHKLHFTDLSGRKWYPRTEAYRRIIGLGVDSLRQHSPRQLEVATHCKMAVMLYPSNVDVSLYGGEKSEQILRHDETTIRMLLKGALHYLYEPGERVELVGMVSDGNPAHRSLDDWRILEQMEYAEGTRSKELREYVTVLDDAQILPLSSDPKNHHSARAIEHARTLQIADLMFGATMRACFNDIGGCSLIPAIGDRLREWNKKDLVSSSVREMLEKRQRGKGFRTSGHHGSFTVSKVEFEEDGPSFRDVPVFREGSHPDLFDK